LDLRYGPGPKETLDLFLPAGPARGTFVFLHGGYWRAFDKRDFSFVATSFVAQGLAVAVVNYDLCPDVSIAAIVDECRRAVSWVVGEGAAHGAHPGRVVVGGHSAGGHLTAMLFATDWPALGLPRARSPAGFRCPASMTRADGAILVQRGFATRRCRGGAAIAGASCAARARAARARRRATRHPSSSGRREILWDAWPQTRPAGASAPMLVPGRNHFNVVVDFADATSDLTRAALALF
jgi:arylformamidase